MSESDDLRLQLRRATSDTRLIGSVLCILGAIPLLVVFLEGTAMTWPGEVLAVVNTAILVGPGVWYVVAAMMMRRLHPYVARVSVWIALAQLVLILVTLAIGFSSQVRFMSFVIPAVMAVFQVPALIALIFVLRKAGRLIKLMQPAGYAFEPLKVQPINDRTDTGG